MFRRDTLISCEETNKMCAQTPELDSVAIMVRRGCIDDEKAQRWRQKAQIWRCDILLFRANQGNMKAMESVAQNYLLGQHGFPKDAQAATRWLARAHAGGSTLNLRKPNANSPSLTSIKELSFTDQGKDQILAWRRPKEVSKSPWVHSLLNEAVLHNLSDEGAKEKSRLFVDLARHEGARTA